MAESFRRRGIFYGWFIVAASFFALFLSTGARNGFGVFIIPMEEEMGWSRSTISWAIAIGWLVNGITQPFIGRLYDRFGGRRVISVSLLALGTGTALLSQVNSIWLLIFLYGFVMSTASGGTSLVTIHAVLSKWFYRRRGVVLSISTSGASAGSMILAPFANSVIVLTDWRVAWLVLGLFIVLLGMPLVLLLIRDNPEQMNELPDGDRESIARREEARRAPRMRTPLEADYWRDSYKTPPMWQLTGAYFVCGMTTAIISAHYVPFAIDRGASSGVAALAFGVMAGLNVVGVLAVGAVSDRMSRKNLLGAVYAMRGLAYAAVILVPGMFGLWAFALIAGFSWIATAPLTSGLTADIYGLRNLGTLNGTASFAHMVGGAISVIMGGLLYDWLGAYDVPFGIAGAMLVGASIAAFAVRERRYSVRYQQAVPVPAGDGD